MLSLLVVVNLSTLQRTFYNRVCCTAEMRCPPMGTFSKTTTLVQAEANYYRNSHEFRSQKFCAGNFCVTIFSFISTCATYLQYIVIPSKKIFA